MSGHSHFSTIKHKKAITDQKRGQIFSKLARKITIAAREKGGDPKANPSLRLAIDQARAFNMPSKNIERAIERGTGELEAEVLQEVVCEAYGPAGIAVIIEAITDNKNRTLNEIKQILNQNNGKLADPGSVKWLFERKGVVTIEEEVLEDKEDLELKAIEAGAEDLYWHDENTLDVYSKIEDLEKVKENLQNQGVKIGPASLDWVAKNEIEIEEKDKKSCQKLFEALDENDGVQEIYSNLKT